MSFTSHVVHLDPSVQPITELAFPIMAAPLPRVPARRPASEDLESMIWKDADLLAQPQVMCYDREPQADKLEGKSAACTGLSQTITFRTVTSTPMS